MLIAALFAVQERFKANKPLNKYNRATFYTQDQVSVQCRSSNRLLIKQYMVLNTLMACSAVLTDVVLWFSGCWLYGLSIP